MLLAVDDHDARASSSAAATASMSALEGSELCWPVSRSSATVILAASSGSSRVVVSARTSPVMVWVAATRLGQDGVA